ncbi:hypothetical protein WME95_49320 [Sorangium sp. So ce327]|jgi:hypothetical protein|uniref:hypothetical protein n=1 Tax=Sorangium sp. So ce327 TaxID=3133301 RepID=UPI003F5EE348
MAYNEQDDHLRLTVLLAHLLGAGCDPKNLKACLEKKTPWSARKKALRELLEEKRKKSDGTIVRLVDPDALDIRLPASARWDDAFFRRERSDLFRLLMDRFDEGGWDLVRPEPRRSTNEKLAELNLEIIDATPPTDATKGADDLRLAAAAAARTSPALQPLIEAMVHMDKLRAREAARMLEACAVPRADEFVIEIAYDTLSVDAIEAAKRLSLLRGPQRWNGIAGAFQIEIDPGEGWTERLDGVPRAAADELARAAWLDIRTQPDGSQCFSMTNAVRRFLQRRAVFTSPERVRREHSWLAQRQPEGIEEEVEIHYHAIASGDSDFAIKTAHYYGADLRKIAFELSTQQGKYDEAATLYRVIVEQFDEEDAYAWEYFAYNLAYHYDTIGRHPKAIPSPDVDRIRSAYIKASSYDDKNPLYKGRELAFRVRLGEVVHEEFGRKLALFRKVSGDEGISFLAKPVLQALRDEGYPLAGAPWAATIKQHPELVSFFQ